MTSEITWPRLKSSDFTSVTLTTPYRRRGRTFCHWLSRVSTRAEYYCSIVVVDAASYWLILCCALIQPGDMTIWSGSGSVESRKVPVFLSARSTMGSMRTQNFSCPDRAMIYPISKTTIFFELHSIGYQLGSIASIHKEHIRFNSIF